MGTNQDYLPIDWYKSYLHIVYNVMKDDGTDFADGDIIAVASDSASIINSFKFTSDSRQIYNINDINYSMVNKNLMESSKEYINTAGQMSFLYPSKINSLNVTKYTTNATTHAVESDNALYNENLHKRVVLTKLNEIHVIVDLKQMEIINSLKNLLLPPTKLEIEIGLETNQNLIYRKPCVANGKILIKNS